MDENTAADIIQDFFTTIHYENDCTFELDIYTHINNRIQDELYDTIASSCKWEMLTEYDSDEHWSTYLPKELVQDGPFNQCDMFCQLRENNLSIGRWQVSVTHSYNHLYICEFSSNVIPSWLMWALNTRTNLKVASMAWKALLNVIKILTINLNANPVNNACFPIFNFYGIQFSEYPCHSYPDDNYINYDGNGFSLLRKKYMESRE